MTDATRIERVAPTITEIADKGGKVILLAHFGRPKGGPDEANSLKPVAAAVADIIKRPVAFATDCIGKTADDAIAKMKNGDVLLLENTRFHKGEEKNDPAHVDGARQARRRLCQRRLLRRPSRACDDGGARSQVARACGTGDAEGARGAEACARQSEAPGRGDRRRRQSVDQARAARQSRQQGRRPHHRRRHGQHVPVRRGQGGRQVAVREGSRRHRALDRRGGGEGQMPHSAAGRRDRRQGAQGACARARRRRRSCSRGRDDPRHRAEVDRRGREGLGEIKTLVWNGPFGAFETPPFDKATMAIAKTAARSPSRAS